MAEDPHVVPPRSRVPGLLGKITFVAVLILIAPIGFTIAFMAPWPEMEPAPWPTKGLIALTVLGLAGLAGLIVYGLARLISGLSSRS